MNISILSSDFGCAPILKYLELQRGKKLFTLKRRTDVRLKFSSPFCDEDKEKILDELSPWERKISETINQSKSVVLKLEDTTLKDVADLFEVSERISSPMSLCERRVSISVIDTPLVRRIDE